VVEQYRGSPGGELEPQRNIHQEAEGADNALSRLMRDEKTWSEISHEEIVASIRKDMAAYRVRKGQNSQFDPVAWMREHFIHRKVELALVENPNLDPNVDRQHRPHAQLLMAWDIIALPHYKSTYERGLAESALRDDARVHGHTITLDPNERKLLDAMAEAVGIPNTWGKVTDERKGR